MMRPVLFQCRGIKIASYPAMLYAGLVAGIMAGNTAAHRAGLDAFRVWRADCTLIVAALVGARLLYCACHWRIYRHKPRLIFQRSEGGLSLYGGLLLAFPLSLPLLAAIRMPWPQFWDTAVFTILVGMIFTKFGCMLNGCCGGRLSSSWMAITLPGSNGVWERRIPAQLLELAWAAFLLVNAVLLAGKVIFPGALFLFMTAAYAVGRVGLQSLRERPAAARGFGLQHWISLATALVSILLVTVHFTRK